MAPNEWNVQYGGNLAFECFGKKGNKARHIYESLLDRMEVDSLKQKIEQIRNEKKKERSNVWWKEMLIIRKKVEITPQVTDHFPVSGFGVTWGGIKVLKSCDIVSCQLKRFHKYDDIKKVNVTKFY